MHLAASGRVIIQLSDNKVVEGQILCDEKGTKIAKVMELIGPIKRPFASATPLTNNVKKHIGKRVFAIERSPDNTKLRRRKK